MLVKIIFKYKKKPKISYNILMNPVSHPQILPINQWAYDYIKKPLFEGVERIKIAVSGKFPVAVYDATLGDRTLCLLTGTMLCLAAVILLGHIAWSVMEYFDAESYVDCVVTTLEPVERANNSPNLREDSSRAFLSANESSDDEKADLDSDGSDDEAEVTFRQPSQPPSSTTSSSPLGWYEGQDPQPYPPQAASPVLQHPQAPQNFFLMQRGEKIGSYTLSNRRELPYITYQYGNRSAELSMTSQGELSTFLLRQNTDLLCILLRHENTLQISEDPARELPLREEPIPPEAQWIQDLPTGLRAFAIDPAQQQITFVQYNVDTRTIDSYKATKTTNTQGFIKITVSQKKLPSKFSLSKSSTVESFDTYQYDPQGRFLWMTLSNNDTTRPTLITGQEF